MLIPLVILVGYACTHVNYLPPGAGELKNGGGGNWSRKDSCAKVGTPGPSSLDVATGESKSVLCESLPTNLPVRPVRRVASSSLAFKEPPL